MDPGTRVEVREGKLLTARSNATGSRQNQTSAQKIHSGWSIGVDKRSSGTLGGLVKLCGSTGPSKIYSLTNNHVVRPQVSDFPADCNKGERQSKWPLEYRNIRSPSLEKEVEYLDRKALAADTAYRLYIYLVAKAQANGATKLNIEI